MFLVAAMHKYLGYDVDDEDFAPLYYPREREDLAFDPPEISDEDLEKFLKGE